MALQMGQDSEGALPSTSQPRGELVGREREVAAVCALLDDPAVRLVTLTGPGGIGKTRLAVAVADAVRVAGRRVTFVDLSALAEPSDVPPAIARAAGWKGSDDQVSSATLVQVLGDQDRLLVLDNFEHVIDAADALSGLLTSVVTLQALVTSRVRLRISGEQEFPVSPLLVPVPADRSVDSLRSSPAVRLFEARAAAVRPGFVLDESTAPVVADICRDLDGIPLAIELAAARTKALSPGSLRGRLANRLELLSSGPRDAQERHRTMRDAIGWSYDLLTADQQRTFRALAYFAGGFTLEAAEHVLADSPDVLDDVTALVDHGLLTTDGTRYRMAETIREYGLECLDTAGEADAVAVRHADHLTVDVASLGPALEKETSETILERIEADLPNLRLALKWCAHRGDAGRLLRLAGQLVFFWYYRGHLREGRDWLAKGLDLSTAEDRKRAPEDYARAVTGAGFLAHVQGEPAVALMMLERGAAAWDVAGDPVQAAKARMFIGGVQVSEGEYEQARPIFERYLPELQAWSETLWTGLALFHLGIVDFAADRLDAAAERLREAVANFDVAGGELDAIDPLAYLALIDCATGDVPAAAGRLREVFDRLRRRGSDAAMADGLADAAVLATCAGRTDDAVRLFAAAYAERNKSGARFPLPIRAVYETKERELRAGVTSVEFERLWQAGSDLGVESATALAETLIETSLSVSADVVEDRLGLTDREWDVLRLLADGKSNAEIADLLFISIGTVRTHVANTLAKLGARSRTEAATIAYRAGLR